MRSFYSVWLNCVRIVDSVSSMVWLSHLPGVIKFCHFRKANTGFDAKLCIWKNNHSMMGEHKRALFNLFIHPRSYVRRNVSDVYRSLELYFHSYIFSVYLSLPLFSLLSSFFLLFCSGYPIYIPLSYVHAFVSIVHDRVYTGRSMGVNSFLWWL